MSVAMRIFVGMGAMIALIMSVGGFAVFQTNSLANTFVEYRGTAKKSLLANELAEALFEGRVASGKFRLTKDPKYLTELSENVDQISDALPELIVMLDGYEAQTGLLAVPDLLVDYDRAMKQGAEQQKIRDELVAQTFASGRKARVQLSDVMATALSDNDAQASSIAGQAASNLLLARLYLERFLVDNNPQSADRSTSEIELARSGLEGLLVELQDPRRRQLTLDTLADLDAFSGAAAKVADVITARNAFYERMDKIGPQALSLMEAAVRDVVVRQNTLGPQVVSTAQKSILIVSLIVGAGAISGALLAFFTGKSITGRLKRITEDMCALADGHLDIDVQRSTESNEIGRMTNAMVVFVENARKAKMLDQEVKAKEKRDREREGAQQAREAELQQEQQATQERERQAEQVQLATLEAFQADMERVLGQAASGNFTNRMAGEMPDKDLAALADVVNRLLEATETNIGDVVSSIGELAKGNLGVRIEGVREGAFERMQNDFNASLSTLSQTMAEIMQSGQSVSSTSSDLEASSLSMAKRAEDSAAAVEETSAAVEEISASISQVVKNARAADDATRRVRESASKTREVSDDTEASINAMTQASAQINSVVKVIEDIAFQINLLALNAGVEAARAGEAGRGFSVVASEVRALAQRSQEAVAEISQVIDQNSKSVALGVEQVGLSRQALEAIIAEVEVASGQITDIALAVEQQSQGIEEVNASIRSIDAAAQTNAATLDVMKASSVAMSEESAALADTLRQFQGVKLDRARVVKTVMPRAPQTFRQTSGQRAKAAVLATVGFAAATSDDGWDEF